MVFWLLALIWRRARSSRLALSAVAIAFAVEGSELYHAAWIDGVRAIRIGALLLGSDFLWSDLVCYAVGLGMALGVDTVLTSRPGPARE